MERFIYRLYNKYTEKRFINKKVSHIKKARFISRIRRRRVNLRNFEPIRKKIWRINLRRILYRITKFNATKQKKISLFSSKIGNKANNFIHEMEQTVILRRKRCTI